MPIYELKVPGADKPRLIKAKNAAEALDFAKVVEIKPASADRMSELMESGVNLEKVPNAADPAAHAPGGELHKPAGPSAEPDAPASEQPSTTGGDKQKKGG